MAVCIKNLSDYSEKIRNVSHIFSETVGTTTSYTFLEDTLRPYIKKNLKEYIVSHWDDGELKEMVESFRKEAEFEVKEGWTGAVAIPEGDDVSAVQEAVVAHALNQIDSRSHDHLHSLIVKDGYSKGHLKAHMFPDVLPAFKKWAAEGKKIYIYSSGQEMSQQCLLSNSVDGDITEVISGQFNSKEFPKTKSESFRELCRKVDCTADKVAFLTDSADTACAARKAGLMVIMLCREGNSYVGNSVRESFPVITSFEDISKHICGKRKKAPDADECVEGKKAKLDATVTEAEVKPEETEKNHVDVSKEEAKLKVSDKEMAKVKEEEEKMEVVEEPEGTGKVDIKTEEAAPVKILVTPPVEEAAPVDSKAKEKEEEADGAEKEVEEDDKKVGVVEEKAGNDKKESEVVAKEVDDDKNTDKEAVECKEDSVKNEEEKKNGGKDASEMEEKKAEDEEKESKEKDGGTKEGDAMKKVEDEVTKPEGSELEERKKDEKEKPKENGSGDAKLVENGDSKESTTSVDEVNAETSKKEVNGSGLNHVNGDEGETGKEKTESATAEVDKAVVKKVENAETGTESGAAPVQESA